MSEGGEGPTEVDSGCCGGAVSGPMSWGGGGGGAVAGCWRGWGRAFVGGAINCGGGGGVAEMNAGVDGFPSTYKFESRTSVKKPYAECYLLSLLD